MIWRYSKVHYILFIVLSFVGVSGVLDSLPIPYRTGFQQSLYAYVQVSCWQSSKGNNSSRFFHSSLVTGSTSHKLVTSDVSRILWMYYNDSVRLTAVLVDKMNANLDNNSGHSFSSALGMSCFLYASISSSGQQHRLAFLWRGTWLIRNSWLHWPSPSSSSRISSTSYSCGRPQRSLWEWI